MAATCSLTTNAHLVGHTRRRAAGQARPAGDRPVAHAGAVRLDPATYRRRRLVVGAFLVLVGALGWTLATWATNSSIGVDNVGADRGGLSQERYVVQPGDTLWTIAATIDSDGDLRDTVDLLADLNDGAALTVGQRLVIGS